jgi:calcineurin-like phosphoesterase family protein
MKTYVTSDHHFYHYNIIKYCDRPFKTIEEMNESMIRVWNDIVKKGDAVFHLGDFSMSTLFNIAEIREQLNGDIYLIRGNHDRHSSNKYREIGFSDVSKYHVVDNILLSHYPAVALPINSKREAVLKNKEHNKCDFVIHGHNHRNHEISIDHYNVAVDLHEYKPIDLELVKQIFSERLCSCSK